MALKFWIEDYPLDLAFGCNPGEQDSKQQLLLTLEISTSYDQFTEFDDQLSHTLNYEEIISYLDSQADRLAGTKLLESIIQDISKGLLKRYPVISSLKIKAEKVALRKSLCKGGKLGLSLKIKRTK